MTSASDLLKQHFQTLVADNARWETLIAGHLEWELPYSLASATRHGWQGGKR
jgi:hypothetical protein